MGFFSFTGGGILDAVPSLMCGFFRGSFSCFIQEAFESSEYRNAEALEDTSGLCSVLCQGRTNKPREVLEWVMYGVDSS
jgi:hypothetical protein